jgi:hypothetical protein
MTLGDGPACRTQVTVGMHGALRMRAGPLERFVFHHAPGVGADLRLGFGRGLGGSQVRPRCRASRPVRLC